MEIKRDIHYKMGEEQENPGKSGRSMGYMKQLVIERLEKCMVESQEDCTMKARLMGLHILGRG